MDKELKGKTIKNAHFSEKEYYNLPKEDFEAALRGKNGKAEYHDLPHTCAPPAKSGSLRL